ncbi:MAG: DUF547 domain-containing protein [Acidobacteria bacterium]|nr:DUF547 domain-containing protein [Acidobacteriota bacterium]
MPNRGRLFIGWSIVLVASVATPGWAKDFDHAYTTYAAILRQHVRPPRVDYAALKGNRAALDEVVAQFASRAASHEPRWSREQRMALWINAYNSFTLRAIVDHYPIQSGWFTLWPWNSIRQIEGVWTELKWQAAGRAVTLDDIEHRILRPLFKDARIHFAVNCASISCPPLAAKPYRPETLDAQLNDAARAYLASAEGVRVDGETLRVSGIFNWYGEDFIHQFAPLAAGARGAKERAILGVIVKHGPRAAAQLARSGRAIISFNDYNWTLNDVAR